MRRIVGIDPGISGACALYLPDSTVPTVPNGLYDLPTMGEGPGHELNYAALRDWLYNVAQPDFVVLERAMAMPSIPGKDGKRRDMGGASTFKFGGSWYAIKAVVACLNIELRHVVMPSVWKRHFNLPGGDDGKEPARQLAIRRFPQIAPFLERKKDHQRAEAFLIARWYVETEGRSTAKNRKRAAAATPLLDTAIDDQIFDNANAEDIPD